MKKIPIENSRGQIKIMIYVMYLNLILFELVIHT